MSDKDHIYSTYARANLRVDRGEGVRLYAEDGTEYLDCTAGIAVNALGHAHPHLVSALTTQANRLWHTSNLFEIPGQERLAARLCAATFADRVFFTNSGAEAIECAIKTARRHFHDKGEPDRIDIITFEGAFHGRTLATIAAGGQQKYLEGFGPKAPGFVHLPFGDDKALDEALGETAAAILIEPIQGEGGIRPVPPEKLRQLREICDQHGILLILDEIQTGVGRTGRLFAHEWAGVTPDLMAVAKGLGGGFPVGACLATEEVAAAMKPGTHGSTFGGNPLAMAVANAVLDVVLEQGFLESVREKAILLRQHLAGLADRYPGLVEDIRGEGLLQGVKAKVTNTDLVAAMRKHRVLTVPAGDNVIRFAPPLTITADELREVFERCDTAFADFAQTQDGGAETTS